MLLPIGDDDRALSGFAYVTLLLLALNVGAFWLQLQNPELTFSYGAIAYQITRGVDLVNEVPLDRAPRAPEEIPQRPGPTPIHLTLVTSMFLHGGWLHLAGNMLYLWIFGDNVEHRFGHGVFLLLYLVSGLAAALAQIALEPDSLVPMVGASGAISGILGAYLVLFPRNRVHAIFFFTIVSVPAYVAIGFWVLIQVVNSLGVLAMEEPVLGGVAYGAHVGGFVAGVLLAGILRFVVRERENDVITRAARRDPHARRMW